MKFVFAFLSLLACLFLFSFTTYSSKWWDNQFDDNIEKEKHINECKRLCPDVTHPLLVCSGPTSPDCRLKVLNDICRWSWNKKICMEKELDEHRQQVLTLKDCSRKCEEIWK